MTTTIGPAGFDLQRCTSGGIIPGESAAAGNEEKKI